MHTVYVYTYSTFIILELTNGKGLHMASESLLFLELYFAIFAAIMESVTLNLAQRLFKVKHFGGNQKPVYDYI